MAPAQRILGLLGRLSSGRLRYELMPIENILSSLWNPAGDRKVLQYQPLI